MSVTFQFSDDGSWSSKAIEWFSAGDFSHVDIVLPDGKLMGARSDKVGDKPAGVEARPPNYHKWGKRTRMTVEMTPEQESAFYSFLYEQRGKPYDKTAIVAFVVKRDWREQNAWFCSELGAACLEASQRVPQLYSGANKITPAALALTVSALRPVIQELPADGKG